jgi:hypothetical protein
MNLDKIFYLLTSFLLTLGVTFAEQRPNVIFLMIDDLGWTDFGCYGSDYYETPNIDKLAASGVKFTNANTACSVCEGSRISILTGQNPVRHGTTFITGKHGYGKNSKTLKSAKQDIEGIQQGSKYREGN